MSMTTCNKCGDVYDSDFQFEVDKNGDCICDRCFEEMATYCDICQEMKECRNIVVYGIETSVCKDCSERSVKHG